MEKIPYFNLGRNFPHAELCLCKSPQDPFRFFSCIMLNKGANVCWCLISSKAQARGYALQILWH